MFHLFAGKAFCVKHTPIVESLNFPSDLRAFLKSCSTTEVKVDPSNYQKHMVKIVKEKLKEIEKLASSRGVLPSDIPTSRETQGIVEELQGNQFEVGEFDLVGGADDCNKYVYLVLLPEYQTTVIARCGGVGPAQPAEQSGCCH